MNQEKKKKDEVEEGSWTLFDGHVGSHEENEGAAEKGEG